MACSRGHQCPECRNGIYYTYTDMDQGRLKFEQCNACTRFKDKKEAAAFLRRFLDWADDLPDEMLPDLPKKGTTESEEL